MIDSIPQIKSDLAVVAQCSDDPDTQTACIVKSIHDATQVIASNRFPSGVHKSSERIARPAKYAYIMHAECRAIANAARYGVRLEGSTMYLNWFPCAGCAQSIVQSGIIRLVADREKYEARKDDPRYAFADSMAILVEGGVAVEWLDTTGEAGYGSTGN